MQVKLKQSSLSDLYMPEVLLVFNAHWGQKRPKNVHSYVPYNGEVSLFQMSRKNVVAKLATKELRDKYVHQAIDKEGRPAFDKNGQPKKEIDVDAILRVIPGLSTKMTTEELVYVF